MRTASPDLLAAIVASVRRQLEVRREREPLRQLERRAEAHTPRGELFAAALRATQRVNVIAECKRRSPSRGVLRARYDPAGIAREYAAAGAAAVSVLTEPTFFDGDLGHLAAVRDAVRVPLLRKDFVVDEYQLLEARAAGADAALLIVAALGDGELRDLLDRAGRLGLAALVEAHTAAEVSRAVDAGASIVGVNNRDLRTLTVDPRVSLDLIERIPPAVIAVAESGLKHREDIERLRDAGYRAFLVGERLMQADSPGTALRNLVGDEP